MENYLLSATIGDIAGSAYESSKYRTKEYGKVKMFSSRVRFTDDTVLTFACGEALLKGLDMAINLWMCANQHRHAGFSTTFKHWMHSHDHLPYGSKGDGSAMRCSGAGWMARSEEECINLATQTAQPTHNSEEGIRGAVATALAIHYLHRGEDKDYVRKHVLDKYYPDWEGLTYKDFHDEYEFSAKCEGAVPPAIICFLDSSDYVDCLRLAISLGGDADTQAAIAGPMAYAYYKEMPQILVDKAIDLLPEWMRKVNREFDQFMNQEFQK